MIFSLLSIGFISLLGQVVLLRELHVAFYGVELIYLFSLGIWLLWTALGALLGRRVSIPTLTGVACLFLAFGLFIPLAVMFLRASRLVTSGIPGAYLPFFQQTVIALMSLLPSGLLSGLLFQWSAHLYITERRTLAAAYAIESAGGLAGGLYATLLLSWGVQNFTSGLLCSIASCITPLLFLKKNVRSHLKITCTVLSLCFTILLFFSPLIDRATTRWNHPSLLIMEDTPYGRITVSKLFDQISVYENDTLSFETEGTEAEHFAHLVALQHPHPERILLLGGGLEGIIKELLKYSPDEIVYVELNASMFQKVIPHLPEEMQKSLSSSNVRIEYSDPRDFLAKSKGYDIILVGMPEPTSGQTNRFYTREFFQECATKLNPGGILGFRLRTAENVWTPPLRGRTVSIYRALSSVFPYVLFLPGETNIVTASHAPLPGAETVRARFHALNLQTRLISPQYIHYLYTNDRFYQLNDLLRQEKAPLNTDIRPACYQYSFLIWMSKFFPHISTMDFVALAEGKFSFPYVPIAWIVLAILFFLSRFKPHLLRTLIVFMAGFIGMILETLLILYYQVKHGILYQDVGILLMSFMAGLAIGASVINSKMIQYRDRKGIKRWWGYGIICLFCLISVTIYTKTSMGVTIGLLPSTLFLIITGFLVAGIFAYASHRDGSSQKNMISPLYAADLAGGCLGSLVSSLFLIPLLGIDITAQLMLFLSLVTLLLV